jgi:undecaprenyl-diphosphatase
VSAPHTAEERRVSAVARWLSPEGYLGIHLVVGFLVALATGLLFNFIRDEVFESPTALAADTRAEEIALGLQRPWLTSVMRFVTFFGNTSTLTMLTVAVAVVLLATASRRRLVMFLATMIGGSLLDMLLKTHFQRARPDAFPHLTHASGYSFPSGHSMGSMLFFGSLAYVVYFSIENHRRWGAAAAVACMALVVLVGGSRIYLGVHYLTDVLAGFAAGLFWICMCLSATEGWIRLRDWRRRRRETGLTDPTYSP